MRLHSRPCADSAGYWSTRIFARLGSEPIVATVARVLVPLRPSWVGHGGIAKCIRTSRAKAHVALRGWRQTPDLDWRDVIGSRQISRFDLCKPVLKGREASATPVRFAKLLLQIARRKPNFAIATKR